MLIGKVARRTEATYRSHSSSSTTASHSSKPTSYTASRSLRTSFSSGSTSSRAVLVFKAIVRLMVRQAHHAAHDEVFLVTSSASWVYMPVVARPVLSLS